MPKKNPAAIALGALGGAVTSEAKTAAARENAKKGGRPKGYKPPKNTQRQVAYQEVQGVLRRGELVRPKVCPVCGKRKPVQAHHDDHEKPLDVKWECTTCHGKGRVAVLMEYQVPPEARTKAKREGVSMRALILRLLTDWLKVEP